MLTVHEKRVFKKMIYSKVTLVILAIIVVLFARGTWNIMSKASYAKDNKDSSQAELLKLEERKSFLESELKVIQTDRGREAEMRAQFDVGREGEKLIVLVDTPEPEKEIHEQELTLWQKFMSLFRRKN